MSAFPNHFLRFSLFLLLGIGRVASAAAQGSTEQETYETQKRLTVVVTRFAEARAAVAGFIRARPMRVQKQEETPDQLTAEFVLPTVALLRLDSLVATLGFVLENNLNARPQPRHAPAGAGHRRVGADGPAELQPNPPAYCLALRLGTGDAGG